MIGKKGNQPATEIRGERPEDGFPEPCGARSELEPSVFSWKSSDKSAEPAYIGSSERVGGSGHESDVAGVRGEWPWASCEFDAEPLGSAPQSGEGINAASKPEGRDLTPENG